MDLLKESKSDAKNTVPVSMELSYGVQAKKDASLRGGVTSFESDKFTHAENNLAVLTLYDNGMIRDCNVEFAALLGCTSKKLIWQHISKFLPQLGDVPLLKGETVNPYLKFLSRVGYCFEVVGFNGACFFSAVFFNDVEDFGRHCLRVIFQPITNPSF